jgi:hypothetical protein
VKEIPFPIATEGVVKLVLDTIYCCWAALRDKSAVPTTGFKVSKTGAPMSWASMTATPEPVLAILDDMVEVYKGTSRYIYCTIEDFLYVWASWPTRFPTPYSIKTV